MLPLAMMIGVIFRVMVLVLLHMDTMGLGCILQLENSI